MQSLEMTLLGGPAFPGKQTGRQMSGSFHSIFCGGNNFQEDVCISSYSELPNPFPQVECSHKDSQTPLIGRQRIKFLALMIYSQGMDPYSQESIHAGIRTLSRHKSHKVPSPFLETYAMHPNAYGAVHLLLA